MIAYYSVPLLISHHAAINGTTLPIGQGEMKCCVYIYIFIVYNAVPTTCPPDHDSIWGIEWPETGRNATVQGTCPRQLGTDISGKPKRQL